MKSDKQQQQRNDPFDDGFATTLSDAQLEDARLMRHLDGELSDAEELELEASLGAQDAIAKLDGLESVGDILRDVVARDERADDIVNGVMASLAAEAGHREEESAPTGIPLTGSQPTGTPANDNSRTLWTMFAAAAAVAAGMFVWGNAAVEVEPTAQHRPENGVSTMPAHTVAPAPETLDEVAAADSAAEGSADYDEDEDAVEIAQLDFGAHSGSVFKVDNDKSGVHTAVVWVNDLGDDE